MDSAFLKLNEPRISNYMGLRMDEGVPYRYSKDYLYIQVPVRALVNKPGTAEEEKITGEGKALRNQRLLILPACTINVRGYNNIVQVQPNPALAEYGDIQGSYYIHPNEGERVPGFYISLRRDLDLRDIDYAIRLYMHP